MLRGGELNTGGRPKAAKKICESRHSHIIKGGDMKAVKTEYAIVSLQGSQVKWGTHRSRSGVIACTHSFY
jgi:hypothetical protein